MRCTSNTQIDRLWRVDCPECELPATEYASRDEARMLAAIHDDMLHRGAPTVRVRTAVACGSCGRSATRVVVVAAGMPPAALCGSCAALLVDATAPMAPTNRGVAA